MKAIDVANFFVDLSPKNCDNDLTKMKLIKLVYFAQAFHLAKNKSPLFEEEVQAWDHGPVIPSVYQAFKDQNGIITETIGNYDINTFSPEDIDFLLDVARNYDKYSAYELSKQSHVKGGPWDSVYCKGLNKVIPKETMADYYADKPFETFELKVDWSKIPTVGYRDKDGHLLLPADMNCPEDDIYDKLYGEKVC